MKKTIKLLKRYRKKELDMHVGICISCDEINEVLREIKHAEKHLRIRAVLIWILSSALIATLLTSCDATKRHQRLIRKHPHLLETISTPKIDTVRIENTKYIECPDGSVITVNCDTVVIYKTNTITLPPTNAQIRQQERTKRNFEDNLRRMYQDSLKHAKQLYKLENKRDEKVAKSESKNKKKQRLNVFEKIVLVVVFSVISLIIIFSCVFAYRLLRK